MAHVYVDSNAAGAGTGADWANAYTTLAAALTAKAAGDNFWVAHNHAESTAASVSLTSPGTAAAPCTVMCVNSAGTVPPVSADLRTTATISVTGSSNTLTVNGYNYIYGIIFNGSTTGAAAHIFLPASAAVDADLTFVNCGINILSSTSAGPVIGLGNGVSNAQKILFRNSAITFALTGHAISFRAGGLVRFEGGSIAATGAIPGVLCQNSCRAVFAGVDLSTFGSGKTLVDGNSPSAAEARFIDCKLGAAVTIIPAPVGNSRSAIVVNSDSSGTNYRHEKYSYPGTQTVENTIVRTGGATDGTTPLSWKIVTTANSKWILPFESMPITFWNDSTSAITTLTFYGTTTGGGVPNNDDIWVEVSYLGSGSFPIASFIATTKADFLAASATTNNSSDASTWGGGGAGNGFKIVVPSFTPAMQGPITVTIKAAKASSTYYIDPMPSISGVTISKSFILAPGVYQNSLSSGSGAGPFSRIFTGQ